MDSGHPWRRLSSSEKLDVSFSADDREEYLDLLSQSASKHALSFSQQISGPGLSNFELKDLSFYNFHGTELSVVVQLEEFLSPLLGKELLNGVQPDLNSSIYCHRLRHARLA